MEGLEMTIEQMVFSQAESRIKFGILQEELYRKSLEDLKVENQLEETKG